MPRTQGFEVENLVVVEEGDWVYLEFRGLYQGVSVKVEDVDGVPQIVGLRLDHPHVWAVTEDKDKEDITWFFPRKEGLDRTITSELLRKLPLRQLRETAVRTLRRDGSDPLAPFMDERTAGQAWPDEHYRAVAETYRRAAGAPVKAIGDRWNVSRATASKWVREARQRGHLGWPVRRGVAGASEKTSPVKPKPRPSPRARPKKS